MTPEQPAATTDTLLGTPISERQNSAWDIRNAPRNYLSLVAYQVLSAAFSFCAVWLITRHLGSEGYGGIVAIIAASQVAQVFVNWSMISLARYGVEEFVETGKISKSFWARTLVFLPNTLVFLAFSFLWLPLMTVWLKLPVEAGRFVAAHFIISAIWLHVQYALQGAKLLRMQGILLAAERTLIFFVLLALVNAGYLDFFTAMLVYIATPLLMICIGLFSMRNLIVWRAEIDKSWLNKMLRFSFPLIPYSMIGYFSTNYVDAIFISQYLTKADLGNYSIAYQVAGILMQLPLLAGSLLMPLFITLQSNMREKSVNSYMQDVLPALTLIWGVACMISALAIAQIMPLIFGNDGAVISDMLLILAICSAVNGPMLLGYGPFSNAISATYVSTITIVVMGSVNIIGDLILIPIYGLVGAAWATVFAYSASVLTANFIVQFRFGIRRQWTLEATVPAILCLGVAWWSRNIYLGLGVALLSMIILLLLHRDSIKQSIVFFSNNRHLFMKS